MAQFREAESFSGSSCQKQQPLITVGEARRILGSKYAKMTEDELRRVIISMEDLARLLVDNPQLFQF